MNTMTTEQNLRPREEEVEQRLVSDFDSNNNHNEATSSSGDDCGDDDITIIELIQGGDDDTSPWAEQDSPEMEERRRQVLLRELQRVQRSSFLHFLILCLIPTSLLFIVVATVLGEEDICESDATLCEQEERTFINAFTTRCVCNAIPVATDQNPDHNP
jgi:hypothetical protein